MMCVSFTANKHLFSNMCLLSFNDFRLAVICKDIISDSS